MEKKTSRVTEVVSVKVYLNWQIGSVSTSYRTRVRVAGLGYRSSNVHTEKKLEVNLLIEGILLMGFKLRAEIKDGLTVPAFASGLKKFDAF